MLQFIGTLTLALFHDALTVSSFDSMLSKPKVAFVKFYAPWCSHCKEMAANWEELGEKYEDDESMLVASVDCIDESAKALCSRFGITGFPTLLYLMPPDQLAELYHGEYSKQNLTDFAHALQTATVGRSRVAERVAELGVEAARDRFAEIRSHLHSTRLQFEEAINMMEQQGISEADKKSLQDSAMEAQSALRQIQQQVGDEYRALKAYLAPHGGTPLALADGEETTKRKKKKRKRKAKPSAKKDEI